MKDRNKNSFLQEVARREKEMNHYPKQRERFVSIHIKFLIKEKIKEFHDTLEMLLALEDNGLAIELGPDKLCFSILKTFTYGSKLVFDFTVKKNFNAAVIETNLLQPDNVKELLKKQNNIKHKHLNGIESKYYWYEPKVEYQISNLQTVLKEPLLIELFCALIDDFVNQKKTEKPDFRVGSGYVSFSPLSSGFSISSIIAVAKPLIVTVDYAKGGKEKIDSKRFGELCDKLTKLARTKPNIDTDLLEKFDTPVTCSFDTETNNPTLI